MSSVPAYPTSLVVVNAVRRAQASPLPAIFRLPVELFLFIFRLLDFKDAVHFSATCYWIYTVLHGDQRFVTRRILSFYGLRLYRSPIPGIVDPVLFYLTQDQFHGLLSSQWNLRWLREVKRTFLSWKYPRRVFTVKDGFLVQLQDNAVLAAQGISFAMVCYAYEHSAPNAAVTASWRLWLPAGDPIDIAVDPDTDTLALLVSRHGEDSESEPFKVIFRTLSKGDRHPLGAGRIGINVEFDARINRAQLVTRLRLCGPLALILIADSEDWDDSFVAVVNWVMGERTMVILRLRGGAQDVAWLNLCTFAVTSTDGFVDVYSILSMEPFSMFLYARLFLPERKPNVDIDLLTLVASSSAARWDNGVPGFTSFYLSERAQDLAIPAPMIASDNEDGIAVMTVATSGLTTRSERGYSITFFISALRSFLGTHLGNALESDEIIEAGVRNHFVLNEHRLIPFDVWGTIPFRITRNLEGHDFTDAVVGFRTLERVSSNNPRVAPASMRLAGPSFAVKDCLLLTDYNPNTAPSPDTTGLFDSMGPTSLTGSGVWTLPAGKDVGLRTVAIPGRISANAARQRVFAENVHGSLTYRELVSRPIDEFSYVLLDENRIWIMRSFSGEGTRIRCLGKCGSTVRRRRSSSTTISPIVLIKTLSKMDAQQAAHAEKVNRSYTTQQIPGVNSYYAIPHAEFRGVFYDWDLIKPIVERLNYIPKKYGTYAQAARTLAASTPEAIEASLRALGLNDTRFESNPTVSTRPNTGSNQVDSGRAPRLEAEDPLQHSDRGRGVTVPGPDTSHTAERTSVAVDSSSWIESWRAEVSTVTSSISSVSSSTVDPPAADPLNERIQAELIKLGVQDAEELDGNWEKRRGSRPKGGWAIYAVSSGRECGIFTSRKQALDSTKSYPGARIEGFRGSDMDLARAWLRSDVTEHMLL
ncbi:hypothetical protein PENSPDRAFT_670905 [Peniophora sp. CONT]|nr:hypothetical protein PENSPDRAFT_670905 [Peniophora sp. CONT]